MPWMRPRPSPDDVASPSPMSARSSITCPSGRRAARTALTGALGALALAAAAQTAPALPSPPAARLPAPSTDTIARLRDVGVISLGHREAALPFSFVVDGRPQGYSVQICLELVEGLRKRLGLPALKVSWVQLQAAERLPAVQQGRVDIECGNTTSTAERRKTVAFTIPTFYAGTGVLVRTDLNVTKLAGLRGKRVVAVASTTGEKVLQRADEALYQIQAVQLKDNAEAFAALESDRAEAWITDDVLLAAYRAQARDPSRYTLLERRHTVEPLALTIRKGDEAFTAAVDAELGALFRSGRIEALYQRWFMQPIPPKGVNLELKPSRLLRESFKFPTKLQSDVDVIML